MKWKISVLSLVLIGLTAVTLHSFRKGLPTFQARESSDFDSKVTNNAGLPDLAGQVSAANPRLPAEQGFLFHVVNEAGVAISGASIVLISGETDLRIAVTGDDGLAFCSRSEWNKGADLMISASEYETAFLEGVEIPVDRCEVVLRHAGHISGIVRAGNHHCSSLSTRISAVPMDYPGAETRTLSMNTRTRLARTALAGPDGVFSIGGLQEGMAYYLEADSKECISLLSGKGASVVASATDVELFVYETLAAVIQFECADAPYLSSMYRPPRISTRHPAGLFPCVWDKERVSMLVREAGRLSTENTVVVAFGSKSDTLGSAVQVRCNGDIPGFRPFAVDVEVASIDRGSIPVHRVILEPSSSGVGSMDVHIKGDNAAWIAELGLVASLAFKSKTDVVEFKLPIRWDNGVTVQHVENIPTGDYELTLLIDASGISIAGEDSTGAGQPHSHVTVEPGQTAQVSFRLPELAYVDIECWNHLGRTSSIVSLSCGPRNRASWVRTIMCTREPKRYGPLIPGTYDLVPVSSRAHIDRGHQFELRAGELQVEILFVN